MQHHLENTCNALYNAFVKLLENVLSKKFLVFITCTLLLIYGLLPAELFITVALSVLGVQTALDWNERSSSLHPREHNELTGPPTIDYNPND